MPGEVKKGEKCPFCGCDEYKIIRDRTPRLIRAIFVKAECEGCHASGQPCMSEAQAEEAWNRRTPAPMTSVVTWVRYTGEPETLPDAGRLIVYWRQRLYPERRASFEDSKWTVRIGDYDPHITDFPFYFREGCDITWSYLPTPPEADA